MLGHRSNSEAHKIPDLSQTYKDLSVSKLPTDLQGPPTYSQGPTDQIYKDLTNQDLQDPMQFYKDFRKLSLDAKRANPTSSPTYEIVCGMSYFWTLRLIFINKERALKEYSGERT